MKYLLFRLSIVVLSLAPLSLAQSDVVLKAMQDEMARSISQLRLADLDKPYFIAYRIDDNSSRKISATLGELTDENIDRQRKLTVRVRVGDYSLDNTNFIGVKSGGFGGGSCGCHTDLPLDDDYDQIRRAIWLETDAQYKQAAAEMAAKRSALKTRERPQLLPDFAPEPAVNIVQKQPEWKVDIAEVEQVARDLSAQFKDSPEIDVSSVDVYINDEFGRVVNSEGSAFTRSQPLIVLDVRAHTRAKDGQALFDALRIYANSVPELKSGTAAARTRDLIARMKALREAKDLEAYNGPVLFEGEASPAAVAQVLAPALIAIRLPISDEPQFESQAQQAITQFDMSLADHLGSRVLPDAFEMTSNPKLDHFETTRLIGAYAIDDEGVPSRELTLIQSGRLKALLSTRTPTAQTKDSTGSDRGMGAAPGNVFLKTTQAHSEQELRKQLLQLAQQRGYGYGVIVRSVGMAPMNALMRMAYSRNGEFNGSVGVYKLYTDGHEELVRAELSPLNLAAFKDIVAAGDKPVVYDASFFSMAGYVSSGASDRQTQKMIPVSYVVPALLFEEVGLKPPVSAGTKQPLLPSPIASGR